MKTAGNANGKRKKIAFSIAEPTGVVTSKTGSTRMEGRMNNKILLDHVDIVTTHMCNNNCRYCIDKFVKASDLVIENGTVDKFLAKIRKYHGGGMNPLKSCYLEGNPLHWQQKS